MPARLSKNQIMKLSDLSNVDHIDEVLDNICVVRIVGTPEHTRVKNVSYNNMNVRNVCK